MRCQICGKKLRKWAYRWQGRLYCRKCFEKERDKKIWDFSVEWNYELVDVSELEVRAQTKLSAFMEGK